MDDLFYNDVVRQYVAEPGYIRRTWLDAEITDRLSKPSCRYVVLVGEPGAGKSGIMAGLADTHPDWLRYFIRRDSTTPLSGGDAVSVLLRAGHQLAARRPELFDPQRLEVVVNQRVTATGAEANVVGVRIEDLAVSPFCRTAIRVEQHVGELGGRLVGLDVAHATVEPRLLSTDNLQYLALLDPAAVLASSTPDMRVVMLVDALDEALRSPAGTSVLDWVERGPELPPNVRIVLSSRPHPRIEQFLSARGSSVELIELDAYRPAVLADTTAFTAHLLTMPGLSSRAADVETMTKRVAAASEGNFAYLRALERGLGAAIASGSDTLLDRLLNLEVLPTGLGTLYAVFLRSAREEISRLGALDIERPRDVHDEVTAAWEGAGQRMVGVLAVAQAPLTIDQLMRLGSLRVWRSAAHNVLQRLRPLLDEVGPGTWRFFHQSVADFLTGDAAQEAPDLLVEKSEWNRRVVRVYRGTGDWSAVDWDAVDDYGLLHLVDHLAELGREGWEQMVALVGPRLRAAARGRFLTDLPFKQLVEKVLARVVDDGRGPGETLADALFLDLVRAYLSTAESRLAPAVFGLMAGTSRVSEALARADLLPPGEHRFKALQAIVASTPPDQRHLLGEHDGVDLLVTAAVEVPVTDDSLFLGIQHRDAVGMAAVALAPHNLDRALALAADAESDWEPFSVHDRVLRTALETCPLSQVPVLVEGVAGGGRGAAAAEVAGRLDPPERERMLALAERHAGDGAPNDRIGTLAALVVAWSRIDPARAASFADGLRELVATVEPDERALLSAAEIVRDADPELAGVLLERAAAMDSADSSTKIRAIRTWAALGLPEKCRDLAEKVLTYERELGWYGPAGSIAELAVALDPVDPDWARQIADEAEDLIGTASSANKDKFERLRINASLGHVVEAFRTWAPHRALRNARLMVGGWISGSSWNSCSGRLSALACLGLDACEIDADLANGLLEECNPETDSAVVIGQVDPPLLFGGLFRPATNTAADQSLMAVGTFMTYMANCVNSWVDGRERILFTQPADVARSMRVAGGEPASWAEVVAAGVPAVAARDLESAIDLAGWAVDPGERLIALAAVVRALTAAGDPRASDAMLALGRAAVDLPQYVAELDLDKIEQAPVLTYLDPSARARWEAAFLLPPEAGAVAEALVTATGSGYLSSTFRAQKLVESLYAWVPEDMTAETVSTAVHQAMDPVGGYIDPIQFDLVRVAAAWALAPWDADGAVEIASTIEHPGRALVAELFARARSSQDEQALEHAVRETLDATLADLPALDWVTAFAMVAHWVGESGRRELTDRGTARLADADPQSGAAGLATLVTCVEEARRAELVRMALGRVKDIGNVYLRNDVLANLLASAALSRDIREVIAVAQRLLRVDWHLLMSGLCRAVYPLVELAGVDVFARLDAAFRSAQAVVGPASRHHLDGVAPPSSRTLALRPPPTGGSADGGLDPATLYLDGADLAGMSLNQDLIHCTADAGDYAFAACDGISTGLRRWLAVMTDPIWHLVDIRFVFPDAERAAAYHAERMYANSEQNPRLTDAPLLGENCQVFRGTYRIDAIGVELTMFIYVFRVGRVVVKLFAAQGVESPTPLEVGQVHALAQRAVAKVTAATR